MSHLFEQFIKERRYLHNLSEGTLTYYRECHHIFNKLGALDPISKGSLNGALITLRERGVKTGAINSYIRGLNVYLKWLAENGHSELLSLKPLKAEQTVLRTFTESDLKAIVSYKPKPAPKEDYGFYYWC